MSIWQLEGNQLKKVSDIVIQGQHPQYVYLNRRIVWRRFKDTGDLLFKGEFTLSIQYINYHQTNQQVETYKPDVRYTLFWQDTGKQISIDKQKDQIQVLKGQVLRVWNQSSYLSVSQQTYTKFNIQGQCYVSGSLINMLKDYENNIPAYSFYKLFQGCPIKTAPAIIFDQYVSIGSMALACIFKDCTNLYELTIDIKQQVADTYIDIDNIPYPMPSNAVNSYINSIDTSAITGGVSWMSGTGGSIDRPKVYKYIGQNGVVSYMLDRPRPVIHTNMLTSMYWIDPIWKTIGSKGFSQKHGYIIYKGNGIGPGEIKDEDMIINVISLRPMPTSVDNKLRLSVEKYTQTATINTSTKALGGILSGQPPIEYPIFKNQQDLTFKLDQGQFGTQQGIMSPNTRHSSLYPSANAIIEDSNLPLGNYTYGPQDIFKYKEFTPETASAQTHVLYKCQAPFSEQFLSLLSGYNMSWFSSVTACYMYSAAQHRGFDPRPSQSRQFPFSKAITYNIDPDVIYIQPDQSQRIEITQRVQIYSKDGNYLDDGSTGTLFIQLYKGQGLPDSSRYVYYLPDPQPVQVQSIKVNGKQYNNVMAHYYATYPSFIILRAQISKGDLLDFDPGLIYFLKLELFDTHVDPNDAHIPDVYFTASQPQQPYTPQGTIIYE